MKRKVNEAELLKLVFLKMETRPYCRLDMQNWDGWTRKTDGEDWRDSCYSPERLKGQPLFEPKIEMAMTTEDFDFSLACGPMELQTRGATAEGIWGN